MQATLGHRTLKQRLAQARVPEDYQIEATEIDSNDVGAEVFWQSGEPLTLEVFLSRAGLAD